MVSTRQQRERLVIDLYNQGKNTRQISEEVRISFRDIGSILKNVAKQKETVTEQTQQGYLSSQAYRLFSAGKTPEEVAIILEQRQPLISQFYIEHWMLKQQYDLYQIYEDLKQDIQTFVLLYRLTKAAGMNVENVSRLLVVANNYLPSVEDRYENLKREVGSLEGEKRNSTMIFQGLNDQIMSLGKTFKSITLDCEKEEERLHDLQRKRMKQEALVKHFENNNEEYIKIIKSIESKVHDSLSDKNAFLKLALFSLIESMRSNPDKYTQLIYHKNNNQNSLSSSRDNGNPLNMNIRKIPPPPYDYYVIGDYKAIVLEEAEKLYNVLVDQLVCGVVNENVAKESIATALPPALQLERADDKQEHHKQQNDVLPKDEQ